MENRSESYIRCKNMMDSVFRESKNKLIDYKIERIKGTLTEVNLNKSTILNTTSTQTNIRNIPNIPNILKNT
jgi:hypothetical protein